jgi:hypothetical protein
MSDRSLHRSPGRLHICLSLICGPGAAMVAYFTLFTGPVLDTAEVRARFDGRLRPARALDTTPVVRWSSTSSLRWRNSSAS